MGIDLTHERFVFHEFFRYVDESFNFGMDDRNRFVVEGNDIVFDPFKHTSDGGHRCADFVGEIGKEIRANLFLYDEGAVQFVDGIDEWTKFVVFCIFERIPFRCTYEFFETVYDEMNGGEQLSNPEYIDDGNETEPYTVQEKKIFEYADEEYPFW